MVGTVFGAGEQARKQASKQAGRQEAGRQRVSWKAQGTANESRVLVVQSGRRVSAASVFRG